MAGMSRADTTLLRRRLQVAVVRCSERCLYQSAKWAAEMLNSLEEPEVAYNETGTDSEMHDDFGTAVDEDVFTVLSPTEDASEARLERSELSRYLMAKSFFDCREFDRCAAVFLPMTLPKGEIAVVKPNSHTRTPHHGASSELVDGAPHLSQKALFLALYAQYMAGEKRKDEESETLLGPNDGGATVNRELVTIQRHLKARFAHHSKRKVYSQGWLEYLYGIVLAKQKNVEEAKDWLIKSVNLYEYNWGAWQELGDLVENVQEMDDLTGQIPKGLMSFIFSIYGNQELFQADDNILVGLKELKAIFPESSFLRTQKALVFYHAKHYEKAERTFSKLLQREPLRLDYLEAYSNILFVMGKSARLAFIAQVATSTDRFRPETCLAVGNYFAQRSEHEKAIVYFRRALTLDRSYQAAWTLMGHEYLELRNTHAAIECYRRAVDINRKDFRAWHGLGQVYELLEMHLYSLYYWQRAAALSPPDAKIWQAMGQCLDKLGRWHQAIKAYKRALVAGTGQDGAEGLMYRNGNAAARLQYLDPEVTYLIALDHDKLNDIPQTRAWLEVTLAQEEGLQRRAQATGADIDTATNASFLGASQSMVSGRTGNDAGDEPEDDDEAGGTGVTATTSKARMWLARLEYVQGTDEGLKRAMTLANELCNDGYEVEEAKGLLKEIRARKGEEWARRWLVEGVLAEGGT